MQICVRDIKSQYLQIVAGFLGVYMAMLFFSVLYSKRQKT